MAVSFSFTLEVPALPDNDIWFVNAQAWSNYWNNIGGTGELDPASTNLYIAVSYTESLVGVNYNVDGVNKQIPTLEMFLNLKAQYDALNTSYQALRTSLKNAGFIDNAQ